MRELHALGFRDVYRCEEALRLSGGEVKGALSLLQRPLLEPFHQRIWTNQLETPIDPKHPDKQVSPHVKFPEVSGRAHLVPAAPQSSQEPLSALSAEDLQAAAGAIRPAQLGALRARPVAASRTRCHLLSGGRGSSCKGVARQGFHPASPQQRVSLLSVHLPPQQGGKNEAFLSANFFKLFTF